MNELKEKIAQAFVGDHWHPTVPLASLNFSDTRRFNRLAEVAMTAIEAAGYAIVPVEPTKKMIDFGQGALDCVPINRCVQQACQVYRAMIEAEKVKP